MIYFPYIKMNHGKDQSRRIKMDLFLFICLSLIFPCIIGQREHDGDILSHILAELRILKEAQNECTNTYSEIDEYKSRVLSLENTVKDLQDTVNDLHRANTELVLQIHRLADNTGQMATFNANYNETKTVGPDEDYPGVDKRDEILNATNHLEGRVKEARMTKSDDLRIRNAKGRSFTLRPTPTKPGKAVAVHIAFTATLSAREYVALDDQDTVIFDRMFTNIGSAYDPRTGIFTAPVSGAYLFSITMVVPNEKALLLEIVQDGKHVNYLFADAEFTKAFISVTKEFILEVNKGSEVWIRSHSQGQRSRGYLRGYSDSLFSGFLLFQTV